MLSFFNKYAGNVHSQNGEDLIIQEILRRIPLEQSDGYRYNGETGAGHCVEAGGNNGLWLSNTRHLLEQGWSGLFVEADYNLHLESKKNWAHNPKVRHQCARVDEKNINLFAKNCDLLSLDTDGQDYDLFSALKSKPKIVIVEIDSSIEPPSEELNKDGAAGYQMMTKLGISKGYFLLCHTGNLIFVANEYRELFPEIEGDGLTNSELYFNRNWVQEVAA